MSVKFGEKLKGLREERSWSQEKLSTELNVSRQAVYKWENNKSYPDIDNLIRISDMFDVSIDELIRDDKNFKEKINIDENFKNIPDAGFYIGMVLFIISAFLLEGPLRITLMILALLSIAFFDDMVQSFKVLFRNG